MNPLHDIAFEEDPFCNNNFEHEMSKVLTTQSKSVAF